MTDSRRLGPDESGDSLGGPSRWASNPADSEADTVSVSGGSLAPPGHPNSLSPGQSVGPYRIERLLGSGGMAGVRPATDSTRPDAARDTTDRSDALCSETPPGTRPGTSCSARGRSRGARAPRPRSGHAVTFRAALERARQELGRGASREGPARISALLDQVRESSRAGGARRIEQFAVRTRDRFVIVAAADVQWIKAAANYAELHLAGTSHLVRATMAELEAGLDPARFARVHRSILVRLDCVREVFLGSHGDYDIVLSDGTTLKMSRRFRSRLLP